MRNVPGDSSIDRRPAFLADRTQLTSLSREKLSPFVPLVRVWESNECICLFLLLGNLLQLNSEDPADELDDDDEIPSFTEYFLPSIHFEGQWESLQFGEGGLKARLLNYARSALIFGDLRVDTNIISWNRLVLLYGPPGTGKTTLCKALAQKLSIQFADRFQETLLVEINAHSLFSKWFSESGKLVSKLFTKIRDMAELETNLVCILIDEVESLTAARKSAANGSEPSDALRAVNAVLTHLDHLKDRKNVVVFCTSNITEAIDDAFLDRADLKIFVGQPGLQARHQILVSCIKELMRVGLIDKSIAIRDWDGKKTQNASAKSDETAAAPAVPVQHSMVQNHDSIHDNGAGADGEDKIEQLLLRICEQCGGLSGRQLRKLPFLTFANSLIRKATPVPLDDFLHAFGQYVASTNADVETDTEEKQPMQE